MDFIIDTEGDQGLLEKDNISEQSVEQEDGDGLPEILKLICMKQKELSDRDSKNALKEKILDIDFKFNKVIEQFYVDLDWPAHVNIKKRAVRRKRTKKFHFENLDLETGQLATSLAKVDVDAEMKKSILKPGMEKEHHMSEYDMSERRLKKDRKKVREATKGPGWFNMPATEITEEIKNDLQVLKMRSVLDPKHFYKKNDMEALPKYFQIGQVMDSSLDHVNERLTKKERKRTMVDELLADAEFSRYNKKKYKEIIDTKRKTTYRTHIRDKRAAGKIEKKKKKVGKKSKESQTLKKKI